jgi:hypothetical protein
LPAEFIDHMRSQGWRVAPEPMTPWVELAAADRPQVDVTFWIAWSRRMGVSVSAERDAADVTMNVKRRLRDDGR